MEEVDHAAGRLCGAWRLVGSEWRMEDTGEVVVRADPRGFAVFEPGGRAMFLLTVAGRAAPTNVAEFAALHRDMTAYTGRYRVQGNRVVVQWMSRGTRLGGHGATALLRAGRRPTDAQDRGAGAPAIPGEGGRRDLHLDARAVTSP